ncbi:signal peptide protein [Moraxella macacae 0408225]|uniref:Signal peptide protein n=1 Tax=Moraxella macacae 0408225 TaxID=1230338 RepID=L2F584_9GAMM|nr:DUF2057 family protein [Moraxella macacae]ELA08045.1 signal peptide protein [Moraxella macacae 0408225]
MLLVKKLALVGLIIMSMPAVAEVTLNVGDYTVVTAINGQEIKTGLFSKPKRQFILTPGKHVITAKYHRLYDLRQDQHDILRSGNVSIPVELADNQRYTLVMANQPDDYQDAKDYAKNPTLAVMQGVNTIASKTGVAGDSDVFMGLSSALGGVFGGSQSLESNQQTIGALENTTKNTATTANASAPKDNTLDQFMQLWLQATPTEREKIRQWIAQ